MNKDLKITKTLKTILTTKKLGEEKKKTSLPGLSMGMGFPWESSHGMGWDSTHWKFPWDGMGQHTFVFAMGEWPCHSNLITSELTLVFILFYLLNVFYSPFFFIYLYLLSILWWDTGK